MGSSLGKLHWSLDVLSLFNGVYLSLALLSAVALALLKRRRWARFALALSLANALVFAPYLPLKGGQTSAGELTLYVHNLYYQNDVLETAVARAKAENPDLVFLMEVRYEVAAQLEAAFSEYPYQLLEPSRYTMGLALFSRYPLTDAEVIRDEVTRIPVIRAGLALPHEETATFVGGHPWPPLGRWGALHRAQVGAVAEVAAGVDGPLVVAGDFNSAAWSSELRGLRRDAGLRDARLGFGLRPTWRMAGLPILHLDHVFVSADWQLGGVRQLHVTGSDHDALVTRLSLP